MARTLYTVYTQNSIRHVSLRMRCHLLIFFRQDVATRQGLPLLRMLVACIILCITFSAHASEAVVILNKNIQQHQLTRSEVRDIFSARKQYWPDGTKITVYVLESNSDAHRDFCRQVLKMFPYQLERLWNQIIYSGQGERPKTLATQTEVLEAVASTPGAVGYAYQGTWSQDVREVIVP